MNLIWLTDIHLNFLDLTKRQEFYKTLKESKGNKILISGDIAESTDISDILVEMADEVQKPIYFVLGNHDYYKGNIKSVREEMIKLTQDEKLLNWLPELGYQDLGKKTFLIGQDGWADGRYGNYDESKARINDSVYIEDLSIEKFMNVLEKALIKNKIIKDDPLVYKFWILEKMRYLADNDAKQLRNNLVKCMLNNNVKKIIILTHVPPFEEVCLFRGEPSHDDFLPFFASKATGDIIMLAAETEPEIEFLVLCGHTHGKAEWKARNNLTIKVGESHYGYPEIQEIIEV